MILDLTNIPEVTSTNAMCKVLRNLGKYGYITMGEYLDGIKEFTAGSILIDKWQEQMHKDIERRIHLYWLEL